MKFRHKLEAVSSFTWAFLAIGILWQAMEWMIYGEIQPRIVDDIITLAWSAMAWAAYWLGRRHGKEE